MNYIKMQQGVGLVEVLVALVILALGILGFAALQLRALEAAQESTEQAVAMNTAQDLAERMRLNRTALETYKVAVNDKVNFDGCDTTNNITTPKALAIPKCNSVQMAQYDATEVLTKASNNGQKIVVADCVKSTLNCIYVSWGKTEITPTNVGNCVNTTTGTYIVDAKCLVMEAF